MKWYRKDYLIKALTEAGIASKYWGYKWIRRMEKEGKLSCPRNPITGHRKFTEEMIKQIIEAFTPGGKGQWYFLKTNQNNQDIPSEL